MKEGKYTVERSKRTVGRQKIIDIINNYHGGKISSLARVLKTSHASIIRWLKGETQPGIKVWPKLIMMGVVNHWILENQETRKTRGINYLNDMVKEVGSISRAADRLGIPVMTLGDYVKGDRSKVPVEKFPSRDFARRVYQISGGEIINDFVVLEDEIERSSYGNIKSYVVKHDLFRKKEKPLRVNRLEALGLSDPDCPMCGSRYTFINHECSKCGYRQ